MQSTELLGGEGLMAPFSTRRVEKDDDRKLLNHTSCPSSIFSCFDYSYCYVRVLYGIVPVYVLFLLFHGLL